MRTLPRVLPLQRDGKHTDMCAPRMYSPTGGTPRDTNATPHLRGQGAPRQVSKATPRQPRRLQQCRTQRDKCATACSAAPPTPLSPEPLCHSTEPRATIPITIPLTRNRCVPELSLARTLTKPLSKATPNASTQRRRTKPLSKLTHHASAQLLNFRRCPGKS